MANDAKQLLKPFRKGTEYGMRLESRGRSTTPKLTPDSHAGRHLSHYS